MHRHDVKHTIRLIAGLVTGLLFAITAISLNAQPLGSSTKAEPHPFYELNKEVVYSGPVSAVYEGPGAGLIPGSHVMLLTGSGIVDASLGKWALRGKGAPTIAKGEQVTVRGVMKTIRNKEVFVVRILEVGGHTYTIRNQHGAPASPQSRERAAQKGVSL